MLKLQMEELKLSDLEIQNHLAYLLKIQIRPEQEVSEQDTNAQRRRTEQKLAIGHATWQDTPNL